MKAYKVAISMGMVVAALGLPGVVVSQPMPEQSGHQGTQHGQANQHMNQRPFEELAAGFDSAERDSWQKPEAVLDFIGDVQGKTVMDIGSGTGYFSFRLLAAGALVICADVDERFLGVIRDRMASEGVGDDRMQLRHVPFDSSTLQPAEVDVVLIVDTYHHIENRIDYFAEVRAGLKPGGKLVIVDFFKRDDPVGPPAAMKMAEDTVAAELIRAGYSTININRDLLPYQYIIEAY
ncbi:MAG: methyltransferase type 11 [Pseudomonadota bacterium]